MNFFSAFRNLIAFLKSMYFIFGWISCFRQTNQPSSTILKLSCIKAARLTDLNEVLMYLYFNRKTLLSCYLVKIDRKLPNRLFTIWCAKIKMVEMDKNNLILHNFIFVYFLFFSAGCDICHLDARTDSQLFLLDLGTKFLLFTFC